MEGTASGKTARSRPASGAPAFTSASNRPKSICKPKRKRMIACDFERVEVNADGIENELTRHHCDDKNDRGIDRGTQCGATPLQAGKRCRQTGKNCHVTD